MPTLDTIRNLTVRGTSQGLDKVASDLDRVTAAQGRVASSSATMATVTDLSSKRTLSAASALERLAAKHDETYRSQQQHARGTALLERATAQGLAGTKEFAIVQQALAKGHHEAGEAAGFNRAQMMEATHVAKAFFDEIMAGQAPLRALQVEGGRIVQIFSEGQGGVTGTLKAVGGMVTGLATGWIGLSVAIGGTLAVGAAAALSWQSGQEKLSAALEGTGRRAGMTLAQINAVAVAGARAGGLSENEGRNLAGTYAHAGFDADLTTSLIGSTRHYGEVTGQGTAEAGASLARNFADPIRGAEQLDREFGFLTGKLQTTIQHLEAQGNVDAARNALNEAYLESLADITDHTWSAGKALTAFEEGLSNTWSHLGEGVSNFFFGVSDDKRLEYLKKQRDAVDPNDTMARAALDTQIGPLQAKADQVAAKAASDKLVAAAADLSKRVDAVVGAILPGIGAAGQSSDRLILMRNAMANPAAMTDLGVTRDQFDQAFGNETVRSANADPLKRMQQDYAVALAAIDAVSVAERGAIEARRAELAVLRDTGDVTKATTAAWMAMNEVIAKANSEAEDRQTTAEQHLAMLGMTPYQRSLQDIENKYKGPGGLFEKDAASVSDVKDAMAPALKDIKSAGDLIAEALRQVAAGIAAASAVPAGAVPFTGTVGPVSEHQKTMLNMLVAAGYNPQASAGFVGGMTGESGAGLDPLSRNAIGAHGIANWLTPERVAGLDATGNPNDFMTQAQFVLKELATTESAAGQALRSATTVQGGLAANLAYERPSAEEIRQSYNARLAAGQALAGASNDTTDHTVMTIHGSAAHSAAAPLPTAAVTPIASTALASDQKAYAADKQAAMTGPQIEPILAATRALQSQNATIDMQTEMFGQSAAAIAGATEKQKLINQYNEQSILITATMTSQLNALADGYAAAAQRSADLRDHQQQLVGAMDDVRGAARSALGSFVSDMMEGKKATQALHDALESVASMLTGKIEDSLVDSLFGKSGSTQGGLINLGSLFGLGGGGVAFGSLGQGGIGHMAGGGPVYGPGTGTSDSVPAMLSHGEFVVNAAATRQHVDLLHAINSGTLLRFADGGMVGGSIPSPSDPAGGGDVHFHTHIDGASGDAHVMALAQAGAEAVFQRRAAEIPNLVFQAQRRTL